MTDKIFPLLPVLRKIFHSFDNGKKGSISTATVGTIFQAMGIKVTQQALQRIIEEVDEDGKDPFIFLPFRTGSHSSI